MSVYFESGLRGVFDETKFIYDVAQGTIAKQLEVQKKELKHQQSQLSRQASELQSLSPGSAKDNANAAYQRAVSAHNSAMTDLRQAIAHHNDIAGTIRSVTLEMVNPTNVGMAALALPLIPIAMVVAASGVALFALSSLIVSIRGKVEETKGLIAQSADALREAGGTVRETGITFAKTAWAVGGVLGAVLVFQLVQDWRKGRRRSFSRRTSVPSALPALPAPVKLKTVKGEVLK